jgi:hypothetical protein
VCSEVAITGNIPSSVKELRVTFNGKLAPGARLGTYEAKGVFPPHSERAIIATVPGDASTGPIGVSFATFLGSEKHYVSTKSFAVKGPTIEQPVITKFIATPDVIDFAAGGTTLQWAISGKVTGVVLDGKSEGLVKFPGGKSTFFATSAHVNPGVTTTYQLAAGNQCISVAAETVVKVLPKLTITASPSVLTIPFGSQAITTVSIPQEAETVTVSCDLGQCNMMTIDPPNPITPSVSEPLTLTPGLGLHQIVIQATLTGSMQQASTSVLVTTLVATSVTPGVQEEPFKGPFQFTNARNPSTSPSPPTTTPSPPVPGSCLASISAIDSQTNLATLSCPGDTPPLQQTFGVEGGLGGRLGGVDSYLNRLFVVADLSEITQGAGSVNYHTFELPQQLTSGGLTLMAPTSPQGFPVSNYSATGGNVPSFMYSPDGSLGLITWGITPASGDNCKNELALYDLLTGKLLGSTEWNGGTPTAKVEDVVAGQQVAFSNVSDFKPCGKNPPTTPPTYPIQ